MRLIKSCVLAILLITLAACGGTGTEQQTLVVHGETMEAHFDSLRTTATVEAELMLATLERSQTELARVSSQRAAMISTLSARGVDIGALPGVATLPAAEDSGASLFPEVAEQPPGEQEGSSRVQVTPFTLTPETQQGTLSDVVMASGVGQDDCAVNLTNQFGTDADRIYVVAVATGIDPGTTLSSRWQRADLEVTRFEFTPDFAINGACIWFFADQTDFDFIPGSYSVTLYINDAAAGSPVPFTVVGSSPSDTGQDATDEDM
jgi:hypothetical protein